MLRELREICAKKAHFRETSGTEHFIGPSAGASRVRETQSPPQGAPPHEMALYTAGSMGHHFESRPSLSAPESLLPSPATLILRLATPLTLGLIKREK